MKGTPAFWTFLLVSFSLPTSAGECDGLLKPDMSLIESNTAIRLSYLHQLEESEYDSIKRGKSSGTKIKAGPATIGQSKSLNEVKTHAKQESDTLKFNLQYDDYRWYYATRIPPERAQGFLDCLNNSGLKLKIVSYTEDAAILKLQWVPPPETPRLSVTLSYDQSQNVEEIKKFPTQIGPLAERALSVRRDDPSKTAVVVVETGKRLAHFRLPPTHVLVGPKASSLAQAIGSGRACVVNLNERMGSLYPNREYVLRYREQGNAFQLSGPHTRGYVPGPYHNASLSRNEVTLWGVVMIFDEGGKLYLGKKEFGKMECAKYEKAA